MGDEKHKSARGAFMTRYGANVAGFFWNAGTALQFLFGIITSSPREIVSSIFNVASPCSYLFFGHRNFGVAVGGIFGIIGTFLAIYPALMNIEAGAVFGFVAFCICVMLNIFSPQFMRRFGKDKNPFLHATLGHSRRMSGWGGFFFCRVPIAIDSLSHGRWQLAVVFLVWGMGDIALSFSRPNTGKG